MPTSSECLLQAENYAIAASMADEASRGALLEQSALWRRRAFELQMLRFEHLREVDPDAPDHGDLAD
ncbi:MAG TPA: hypothetical protein VGO52_17490 [Hyphomonadaceae bacterium]|jgi:hypothetical protein|nr:hypothetical protein [Hyphomonadaceae bacterium]